MITKERIAELQALCAEFRRDIISTLYKIQTGHPGGSLSAVELITALYFEKMRVNPQNPGQEGRDRFVLSKGHGAPLLYLALAKKGFFPKSELSSLRQAGSMLQGHPCAHKTPGVDVSSGPLGLGLGAGLGIALSEKRKGSNARVYVLLGDGEIQEGVVWEAAMAAAKFRPGNLVAILDNNGVQLDGSLDEIMPMGDIAAKFTAFGWKALMCDGHDIAGILDALYKAESAGEAPVILIARTVKGKGVSFMEGKSAWHGKPIGAEEYREAMRELGGEEDDNE